MAIGQRRTADRIQVGATIKRMRLDGKVTREQAADALGCTTTTIGNIEQGRTKISHGDLTLLMNLYGVPEDQAADLIEVNREARRAVTRLAGSADIYPHQRRAADLIKAAHRMRFYSPEVFPGLLQDEGYARAIMAPTGHMNSVVENRLSFRLGLGEVLARTEQPPLQLWVVVGEAALHKNIGGPAVMRNQLRHVVALCRARPNIAVQVLPFSAREHYLLGATVTIYTFDMAIPEIASIDTTIGEYFLDRDSAVSEAIGKFDDVRTKAFDPLTSLDMIEERAHSK
ncbi:MAG: helix-turn-helix domain-containing protein [Actinomycetota bacterium]|nr:helix-turn-helix domain-containing protein [Actinomycetota bacterium]